MFKNSAPESDRGKDSTMRWLVPALLLPACIAATWLVVRLSFRRVLTSVRVDQARDQFRFRREWLEARFLDELGKSDAIERMRWEEARWEDGVVWARDRQTGRLLALVGIRFEADPFEEAVGHPERHATVVFEYERGRWRADGKRLDEISPDEAFLRHQRYEPVTESRRV